MFAILCLTHKVLIQPMPSVIVRPIAFFLFIVIGTLDLGLFLSIFYPFSYPDFIDAKQIWALIGISFGALCALRRTRTGLPKWLIVTMIVLLACFVPLYSLLKTSQAMDGFMTISF